MKTPFHIAALVGTLALTACAGIDLPGTSESAAAPRSAAQETKPDVPRYGAIAFSDQSQRWRFRWNVIDPQRAADLAMQDCGDSGCRILLTFGPAECGTFALGQNSVTAAAKAQTPRQAETEAKAACNDIGAGCRVAPAQCNT